MIREIYATVAPRLFSFIKHPCFGASGVVASLTIFLIQATCLQAAPSPIGTGLLSNITLGALQDPSVVNQKWPSCVYYDLDLTTWRYDVYVPPTYDGTKPFGVMVYISSVSPGAVLSTAAADKNLIWIAPRNVQNSAAQDDRFGAALLALYRAKELFNIDPHRVYTSGLSGGARVASALAFLHSEVITGTAPSSGECVPRLNAVTPDYIPETSSNTDTYYDYSIGYLTSYYGFSSSDVTSINADGITNKLRSYLLTRYDDHREEYIVEAFHCAYEPQGQIAFLYDGVGGHQDASDAEMEEAISYLDRYNDSFPVNANVTAGSTGFDGMTNISQSGATAVAATTGSGQNAVTTYTLTPTLTATAATKSGSSFYWDNANGSTVRWLWEVKNAAPTNQKTSFGLWFTGETWGGGAPVSVTSGTNPGILITISQTAAGNRMVVSARPDSGGETIFYDGYFNFVSAYSTAWTSTHTGYLTGTGSPVEIRMDLNQKRWQLTFNGIVLNGTTNSIANGTAITRDNKRMIFGYWDSALGTAFWKHNTVAPAYNSWSPFTKSIFTAATGAVSGTGTTPSPMELRYVIASEPSTDVVPIPLAAGPSGLAAVASNGTINFTWNALAGATSYDVKRATASGGPYTTIQNVSSPSYTDSSVVSGTVYYYTVSAVTASGSTANAEFEVAAGVNLPAATWTGGGADGNWLTAANWSTLPVAGDTLSFTGGRLTSVNNYTANTSFGGLVFNSGGGAFTLSGNAIALSGNVTNNSSNAQTIGLALALASGAHSVTTNASGNMAMGGVISGSGSLTKAGAGTLTLSAIDTYSGGTTVDAGTLVLATGGGSGAIRGTATINSGATMKTTATDSLGYNSGSVISQLNIIGGTFDNGVNANQGYRTNVSLTGGTLSSSGGGSFNFTTGFGITSLASTVSSTISSGVVVRDNLNMTINVADGTVVGDLVISGVVSGTGGAITKTGAGLLSLTGANTFDTGVTLNAGTVGFARANGTNTNLGAGAVTVNTGAILRVGYTVTSNQNISTTANAITLAGGSIYADDANQHLSGAITVSASGGVLGSTYNAGTNSAAEKDKGLALDGVVSGSGALTIQHTRINTGQNYDTSFVAFSNNSNSYSGTLTINENTTTSEGGVYLGVNGTTALQNATVATSAILGTNLRFGSSPIVFKTGLGSATIGAISGSGPLVLTGYDQVNHAYGTDAIALTVGGNNATTTYSAAISGLGSLIKAGTGMMTLSATNTYSGGTTLNGGILNITGALSSASGPVTVNSGGTLAGTGSVAGATTVASGGAISPGNGGAGAAGTLTMPGALTLSSGAVLNMDLAGTTTSDKIAAGSSVTATGTTTINLNALAGFAGAGTYPLITSTGTVSAANFAVGTAPAGYSYALSASSGTLSVTVTAPPAAPTGVSASSATGSVSLSWTASAGATSYTVKRSLSSGSGYAVLASGLTSTTYVDTTLENGTTYYYTISAINAAGAGVESAVVHATPIGSAQIVTPQLTLTSGTASLSLTTSVSGRTYQLQRSYTLASGSWVNIGSPQTGGGSLSFSDIPDAAQAKVFYRLLISE